jgi:hypothetical protein
VLIDALLEARQKQPQHGGATRWFETFNARRLPDAHGLGMIARYLNSQNGATGPMRASMVGTTICQVRYAANDTTLQLIPFL